MCDAMTDHARQSALTILNTLSGSHLTLDAVMNDFHEANQNLDKRDLSLVNALVFGVIRWQGRLDHIIAHFSKTPLLKIKTPILNILRLGVFQIAFMTRIPDSAAVNTSVDMAKKNGPVWVVKFVNGVLRNVARSLDSVPFPAMAENKTLAISVDKSFPTWLVQKWLNRFGDEDTLKLCDRLNTIPPISIRVNTLKTDRSALINALSPHVKDLSQTACSADALTFSQPDRPIPQLPGFEQGWFQVQDEAAQLVSILANPKPGQRVLDACAGLGGKTGHLAQLMENSGDILAMDHDKGKLTLLDKEMKRLGITIVKTQVTDLENPLDEHRLGRFDIILLDAPCSGMGVIQRNPDSKWRLTKKNLNRYKKRQLRFLNALVPLLKPSGVLVYAVCSTEPEENDAVIDSFLHAHPDFHVLAGTAVLEEGTASLMTHRGYVVSFPHEHGMDGFFTALLSRRPD